MKKPTLLKTAGVLAIAVALFHGIRAEMLLFPAVTAATPSHLMLLRFVWQASSLAWISFGVLLMLASGMGHKPSRTIAIIALIDFGICAIGTLVATGPAHPGWMLLTIISVLIAFGMPSKVAPPGSS
jgi:hypothetical protein